jgi:hypothetical protein
VLIGFEDHVLSILFGEWKHPRKISEAFALLLALIRSDCRVYKLPHRINIVQRAIEAALANKMNAGTGLFISLSISNLIVTKLETSVLLMIRENK